MIDQRYPQPGDPNPDVRVGVVSAGAAKRSGSSCPSSPGRITFRVSDGSTARRFGSRLSPATTSTASIYFADAVQRRIAPVLEIDDDKFLDENYDVDVDRRRHRADQLERRPQSDLSLQLRPGQSRADHAAKLERQLTKGDFEVSRRLPRRSRAQDGRLRLERRQSAGAADLAGELRRRAQAAEHRGRAIIKRTLRRQRRFIPTSSPRA